MKIKQLIIYNYCIFLRIYLLKMSYENAGNGTSSKFEQFSVGDHASRPPIASLQYLRRSILSSWSGGGTPGNSWWGCADQFPKS